MPATGKRRPADSKKEDPEIAGFGDETQHFFESSDDEELSDSPLDFSMQEDGRLRLRPDISMDGPKYIGKKSSRKTAFENGDSDEDASLDDEDEKETDGENLQIKFDDGDDDALMEEWQANNAENDELEALNREYEEIRQQEEEMVKNLKGQGLEDHEKGEAVGHQKMLWDRALEVRIALQKMVQGANQMPGVGLPIVVHAFMDIEMYHLPMQNVVQRSIWW
jgi:protein AATF/BFR2